jgi:N,N'-diacetyllegionaminate synthase
MKLKKKNSLNNSKHCFVIAEAGSNWKSRTLKESIVRAKKMIDVAAKSGADAIKFQTYSGDSVYVENAGQSKYLTNKGIKNNVKDVFDKFSMPHSMLPILSEYCKKRKIAFMSTPFSIQDAKEVNKFVKIHKIASYELNHTKLLEVISKTRKPVIISTGANTLDEIDYAIKILKKNDCKQIAILQCTAKYPAPIESLNLNVIPELKKQYDVAVGFSDHSIDPIIGPLTALNLGATIIEKHFTLDKSLKGPDHYFALNPKELKTMIKSIRESENSKGDKNKKIDSEEKELRQFAVRSIQAIKNIKKGEQLGLGKNMDILRPGNQKRGEEPRYLKKIQGKKAKKTIKKGIGILEKDCY